MRIILLLILLTFFPFCYAQENLLRIMFYNVENLFDTEKDSVKQDEEFLPQSIRAWHYGRYKKKLTNISRVITAVGEWSPPSIVGLCEVENDRVLQDLTKYSPLKEHGYRYVMTDSPDARGIDVALLYQRDQFKLLGYQSIKIDLVDRATRDLLHVTGIVQTLDTLDIIVAHFPSRSQGQKASEPYRIKAAKTMRKTVDSLFIIRRAPRIIIMGDLNDYPKNKSISQILNARIPQKESCENNQLYHLLADKSKSSNYGSHKYQGEWGLLDHIIVSGLLLDTSGALYTNREHSHIATLPFLLTPDEKYGGQRPFRTYHGMKYEGGYSDHLPVYVDLLLKYY
ncbi:endonuclease [Bacteroides sp. 519]|nr:endonuclease [Bacteroides sp. 519]